MKTFFASVIILSTSLSFAANADRPATSSDFKFSAMPSDIEKSCHVRIAVEDTLDHGPFALIRTSTDALNITEHWVTLIENLNFNGPTDISLNDVGLVDGVTYHYTLSRSGGKVPTSKTVNCRTKKIYIQLSALPTQSTCYLGLNQNPAMDADGEIFLSTFNPYATYEWGYMEIPSWTGIDGVSSSGFIEANCGNTAVCTQGELQAGRTYFFALRAKNLLTEEVGRWSPTVACKPQ